MPIETVTIRQPSKKQMKTIIAVVKRIIPNLQELYRKQPLKSLCVLLNRGQILQLPKRIVKKAYLESCQKGLEREMMVEALKMEPPAGKFWVSVVSPAGNLRIGVPKA